MNTPSRHRPVHILCAVLGTLSTLALFALLYRLLFQARAQSFDAMIYTQGLWGLGHGEFTSSLLHRPTLAIHANWVLVLLAPLTNFIHATKLLIAAQSIALGVTTGATALFFARATQRHTEQTHLPPLAALLAAFLVTLGSPLVLNPFFFDVRPEMIGVPLLTIGLLRAVEREGVDRTALLWMLSSVLCREEFALVVGSALALSPPSPNHDFSRRTLWGMAIGLGVYFVGYFLVASALGDSDGVTSLLVSGGNRTSTWADYAQHKTTLLAIFATSVGLFSLLGWRWLAACIPGLGLLLINRWLLEGQLNFHYSALVAPGLIAASLDGYRRWLNSPPLGPRAAHIALSILIAGAHFGLFSAAPFGGRFFRHTFDMDPPPAGPGMTLTEHTEDLQALYTLLDNIQPEEHIAVPFAHGTPYAERPLLALDHQLRKSVQKTKAVPKTLSTVVLSAKNWASLGQLLTHHYGFRLIGFHQNLAVLSRAPWSASHKTPWSRVRLEAKPAPCTTPLGRWPHAGLTLCAVQQLPNGTVAATLERFAAPHPSLQHTPLELALHTNPKDPKTLAPLQLMQGLIPPSTLPSRVRLTLVTPVPIPTQELSSKSGVLLLTPQRQPLPPSSRKDTPLDTPHIPLEPSTPQPESPQEGQTP